MNTTEYKALDTEQCNVESRDTFYKNLCQASFMNIAAASFAALSPPGMSCVAKMVAIPLSLFLFEQL